MGNAQALEDAYELQCKEAVAVEKLAYDLEAKRYQRERAARYRDIAAADAQQQKMAAVVFSLCFLIDGSNKKQKRTNQN